MSITTPRKPDRPILWIIAGPNGSGKSTLYNRTDIEGWGGSVWIINPDLLTATIVEREEASLSHANGNALDRIEAWLYASLETYQTIGVETVLSSDKYRRLVERAKHRGFDVRIMYVVLSSARLQIRRIAQRVFSGGHDVAAEKVIDRRRRSFAQLAWFAARADQCLIFDNSGGNPELIAEWRPNTGSMFLWNDLPVDLQAALVIGGLRLTDDIDALD